MEKRRVFEKLSHCYAGFAVLFLNLVILLVLALLAIQIFLDIRTGATPMPVYSSQLDLDSYALIDRETAIRVGQEFDQMGDHESYIFNPWTTFMEAPFQGKLLTVENHYLDTTRGTKAPAPLQANQSELLVWTFGGSTMFGWGLPDDQTIASHLQDQLQIELPHYRVRVINHGHSYYFSSMEVALYIALLRVEARPQIVVFLDGINDAAFVINGLEVPAYTGAAEAGWESERQKRYGGSRQWVTWTGSFPLVRLARYLQSKSGKAPPPREAGTRYPTNIPKGAAHAVNVYRLNRDMARLISEQLGVDPYFFLQPSPFYLADSPTAPKDEFKMYQSLISEAGVYPKFFTLHDTLWNVPQSYVDTLHYSDAGSLILAQHMARFIAPQWK